MATATSPNIGLLNTGGLMPRISSSGKSAASLSTSRGSSSPLERVVEQPPRLQSSAGDNNSQSSLMLGMPAEHSSPQPSIVMTSDTPDGASAHINHKTSSLSTAHQGSTSGFASFASFAGSILSSNSDETSKRQKLEKYRKKLRENLAEQEILVNKQIASTAAAASNSHSQRNVREFEQKIHVLAGKAQKLGRSIASLESQLAAPSSSGANAENTAASSQPGMTSRPSAPSLGKLTASTAHTPPNTQLPVHGTQDQASSAILQRAASSSSSQSQTQSLHGAVADPKAATLPTPSGANRSHGMLKDVKESITSHFRLRSSNTSQDQLGAGGTAPRKFGSADNLHQLNLSNISSSSGSCETAGSGVAIASRGHHQAHHAKSTAPAIPSYATGVLEKPKPAGQHAASSHTGVPANARPPPTHPVGEKANAGTLPARLRSSTSYPYFKETPYGLYQSLSVPPTFVDSRDEMPAEHARPPLAKMLSLLLPTDKSFKYVTPGENVENLPSGSAPPLSATSATSGVMLSLDEQSLLAQTADDTASQMTTGSGQQAVMPHFNNSYHFQTSPLAYSGAVRDIPELKELKSEVESLRLQLQMVDRHWNEKLEHLRLELTDVKYLLHTKPSRDDIQVVSRRCEDYSASSSEAVEHLRTDVMVTKSELSRQDQDLDNAIERLRRRVEELDFDAVVTRLTLVEAKVSQVSNYVPGPEPSLRNVAAKLLNVLFALVALFLLLISTAISVATPFIRTRIRIIFSAVLALVLAVMYHFWLWRLFADDETLIAAQDQT